MMSMASAFALCCDDEGIEVVLSRDVLGKALGPEVAESGIFDDIFREEKFELQLHQQLPPTTGEKASSGKRKRKAFQPRQYEPRTPKEESNWWRHYLCENKRALLELAEAKRSREEPIPLAAQKVWDGFYSAFRVHWSVFLELKNILLDRKFYDPTKKDILGFSHDVELLHNKVIGGGSSGCSQLIFVGRHCRLAER